MKIKFLTSFKRVIVLGWKNFSREMGLSFVSIFVLTITILLVTSMFLLRGVSDAVIAGVEDKADITIDFEIIVSEEKILEIKEEIKEKFEINGMEYVSREDARVRFIERFGDRPAIMDSLDEVGNPFPASINIKAGSPQIYSEISDFLEDSYPELIYAVDFYGRKEVIESIFSFTEKTRRAGITMSLILGTVALLLVFNTVKLAIYGMKEEIRVMRLVGSSNIFIQGSFITQGTILGFVSALISFLLFLAFAFLIPNTYNVIFDVNLYGYLVEILPVVLLVQFCVGVGLGVVSSSIATARYLK